MLTEKKANKIITEAYEEIYKKATPKADFNKLVKNAKLDEFGQRDIGFENYTMNALDYEAIISDLKVKYKLTKREIGGINTNLLLGATPRFV